uniref:RdRp n=1 Tax=viral metagenome TaxID=1070528 RepID=A0A2V0RHV0_9ZZZZ
MGEFDSQIRRNENVWAVVREKLINTTLLLPSGQHLLIKGTVPSGTEFTTMIETVQAQIAVVFSLFEMGFTEDEIRGHLYGCGDDQGFGLHRAVDTDVFATQMEKLFYTVKPESVMQSRRNRDIKLLGYYAYAWHPHRPEWELWRAALFPERYVGNEQNSLQRIIGQNIGSGQCNAAFDQFARLCVQRSWFLPAAEPDRGQLKFHKHVLGIDRPCYGGLEWDTFVLT